MAEWKTALFCVAFFSSWVIVEEAIIKKLAASSVLHCCLSCALITGCKGFTYDSGQGECVPRDAEVYPTWSLAMGGTKTLSWMECTHYEEPPPVNIAQFYVNVTQSSVSDGMNASLAVDGISDPGITHDSCAKTLGPQEPEHWLKLTLNDIYTIARIVITNRKSHISAWLRNCTVTLDDGLCHHYTGTAPPRGFTVRCDGGARVARTLEIRKTDRNSLVICEIEIYSE